MSDLFLKCDSIALHPPRLVKVGPGSGYFRVDPDPDFKHIECMVNFCFTSESGATIMEAQKYIFAFLGDYYWSKSYSKYMNITKQIVQLVVQGL